MTEQANINNRQVEIKCNCLVITIPQAELVHSVEHFGPINEPDLFQVTDHTACLKYFQEQLQQLDLFGHDPILQLIDEIAGKAAGDEHNRSTWIKETSLYLPWKESESYC